MAKFEIQAADSSPCPHCNADVPVDLDECPSCEEIVYPRYTAADFIVTFFQGHIIDVRAGGLVLGRNHNEDDIPMLNVPAMGIFQLVGRMMGGEYILNREASTKHMDKLIEINSYSKDSEFTPIEAVPITEKTRVFNTNGIKGELMVFVDSGQFIVNRAATAKYYHELEELNNSVTHKLEDNIEADDSDD